MAYINNNGQIRVGVRPAQTITSSLLQSIYGVWNADILGTSLDTSIFRAYNGEAATVTSTQLNTNIFGVWNADGTNNLSVKHAWNANGDAVDSKSGANGTIATPSGTSWTPTTMTYGLGKLGSGAFTFNGSNFVSLPADTLNFTGDFSVSAWIYVPTAFGTNISRIISCFDNQTGPTTYRGWEVVYNNGTVKLQIYPSGANYYIISVPMTLKDQWVHVTAVRIAGQQGEIYINGVAGTKTVSSNGATSASAIAYGTGNLAYIGALYDSGLSPRYSVTPAGGFKIDSIQTFNDSALDQTAVTELYNSGNGQEYPFTLSNVLIPTYKDAFGSNHGTTPASTLTNGVPGPSFTTGKIGKAFNFDGINDIVVLPGNSLKFTEDFTVSYWFLKPLNGATRGFTQISCYNYVGSVNYGWNIYISNCFINFSLYGSSIVTLPTSNRLDGANGTINIANSGWHHVVITRKSGTRSRIYVDGVLQGSNTSTVNPVYDTTSYSTIGGYQHSSGSGFTIAGKMDAISSWNRELSADEITALYNSGNGQQYPFSSVTLSNSILDSVNTQNGTNVNGVTFTTGKVGNAFTFNGSNYIQLPDNSLNSLTGDFSISVWIYLTGTHTGGFSYRVLDNSSANVWFNNPNGFTFAIDGDTINFDIFDNTNTYRTLSYGMVGGFVRNTWYHVAVTRKSGTGSKIYLNGSLVASNTNTVNPTYLATISKPCIGAMNIPARGSVGYYAANGNKLDALNVWNKELNAEEVFNLYNDGAGAEYPFTSQYLASLKDSVGSNDGTRPSSTLTGGVLGPSFTTGKIGKAFSFDGINDMVTLPNNSLTINGDFSASAWVKYTIGSGIKTILSNNALLTSPTRQYGWGVYLNGTNILFQTYDGTSTVGSLSYAATLTSGTWYHITVTKSGTTKRIYLNGVEVANASVNNITYTATHRPTIGGQRYDATGMEYFSVSPIDAVSVWNRELTATEVTELYNSGNGKQYPNY